MKRVRPPGLCPTLTLRRTVRVPFRLSPIVGMLISTWGYCVQFCLWVLYYFHLWCCAQFQL